MRDLSLEELAQRMSDFMANILTHSMDAAKIAPMNVMANESWWVGFTHVLEELDLRGESWRQPSIDMKTHLVMPRSERVLKSMALAKRKSIAHDGWHYKFGKREHMGALINKGTVRIAPASSFSSSALNGARRDDELNLATKPAWGDLADLCRRDGIHPPQETTNRDWIYVTQAKTDYFVYCMAERFDHRLFDDFEADSCVLFHDPSTFEGRLRARVQEVMGEWRPLSTQIEYIDPLFPPVETLNPFFCKHFRFFYQREYRHIWMPSADPGPLKAFFVDLGSLQDIAELVMLD